MHIVSLAQHVSRIRSQLAEPNLLAISAGPLRSRLPEFVAVAIAGIADRIFREGQKPNLTKES